MAKLGIGEVARRSGVSASAIRYYEGCGLLPRVPREGGRRIYDEGVLDRLAVIELAKGSGFTLREIQRLLRGLGSKRPAAASWRRLAAGKLHELDGRIAQLERMRELLGTLSACDCPTLEDCGRALRASQG